jgi:hypothetical protein
MLPLRPGDQTPTTEAAMGVTTGMTDGVARAAREATAEVAPWIERLARVGFVAKALLYITVGWLAAQAALGDGGRTTGSRGALSTLLQQPLGRVLLALIALGLFGYAAWRIVEGVADAERKGTDAKGLALRGSYVSRGIIHLLLGVSAARMAMGAGGSGDDGQRTESFTARALALPAGEWLVGAAGVAVAGYGLYQLVRAFQAKLSRHLDLAGLTQEAGRWAIHVSRFGIAARGVVFVIGGVFLVRAAMRHDATEAAGAGESLAAIGSGPFGTILLAIVAVGVIAYGIYQLINARYRRIAT